MLRLVGKYCQNYAKVVGLAQNTSDWKSGVKAAILVVDSRNPILTISIIKSRRITCQNELISQKAASDYACMGL